MPRPKVDPKNRQRATAACHACRSTHKRCSGSFPCAKCIRTGRADTCRPASQLDLGPNSQQIIDRPRRAVRTRWNSSRICNNYLAGLSTIQDQPTDSLSSCSTPRPHHESVNIYPPLDPAPPSPEAPHQTHPRMLRNLQGERVYIGKAASISFLQLLRDTVTQHIGPSQFSHNVKSEDMLETGTPHEAWPAFQESDLQEDQWQNYLQTYRIATSGFIELSMDPLGSISSPKRAKSALEDMMIAIGAQSTKNDPASLRVERYFVARGQKRAFAGMLENPSLEIVQLFVLMSFYMLGACRRNAAFMYLGVAARAAVALGLHLPDSSESLPGNEQDQRLHAWMSLCTLDLLISSILGRPPATAGLRSDTAGSAILLEQRFPRLTKGMVASFRLSQIVDEIIVRLYSGTAASAETAESILDQLTRWSDSLPPSLLALPETECERSAAQEHIIGSLHVACSYHFAVILVTRPFLISVLGIRLARLQQSPSTGSATDGAFQEEPAHSRLAGACIDSALYMMQTCMEVQQSQLLLGNMCILKAFVFAGALVLGFSMFSRKEANPAVEEAFDGAREILRMLSRQSAQAGHYLEIVTLLGQAIVAQQQRLRQNPPQSQSRYVSKLFSLNGSSSRHESQDLRMASATADEDDMSASRESSFLDSWIDNGLFSEWEGMELPSWDSFPFTEETMPGI